MGTETDDLEAAGESVLGWLSLGHCPRCDRITELAWNGDAALCLRCTEAELGFPAVENGVRIGAGMSIAQWLSRPPDEPWPTVRPSSLRRRLFGRGFVGG